MAGDTARITIGPPPNPEAVKVTIVDTAPDAALIELADGSKWSMTPRQPEESPAWVHLAEPTIVINGEGRPASRISVATGDVDVLE